MTRGMEVTAPLRPAASPPFEQYSSEGSPQTNCLSYDAWARLLADFFFDEAHEGQEILFAVDGASLEEISGLDEDVAVSSLAAAVRYVIGRGWGVGCVTSMVRTWRRSGSGGPHLALPFLALTVLAASRMGESLSFAGHNYYRPLRHLLDPDDSQTGPPGSLKDHVDHLWHDLAHWANEDLKGRRGRLVVRDMGHHHYVGLAIQHALVKSSDLRQLDRFFRRIGLQPGEEVPAAELRRALVVWTAGRPEPWARRLARISSDERLSDHCEALLAREARRWDGLSRDPRTGRPVGHIRVGIGSMRRPEVGLYVQWDERMPELVQTSIAGEPAVLTRSQGWYEPHPLEAIEIGRSVSNGVEVRGSGYRFDLRPEEVYALTYDDDLGAWVSTDAISYGDRYHLLVRREVVPQVLRFVRSASSGEPKVDDRAARWLPAGWCLVVDVRIDSRPSTSPPGSLASLIPAGPGPRLRLLGGLPLTAASGVYLRGGEPSLALSSVSEDDHITIRRESTGETVRLRADIGGNRELRLGQLQLQPDRYEIRHGESRVTLQIVDGIAESAGPGVGRVVHRGARSVEVSGTTTSAFAHPCEPVTVRAPRAGEAAVILGARPGEHLVVQLPAWLSAHFGFDPDWRSIDAWPDFNPVWHLLRGPSGRYEASMIAPIPPEAPGSSETQWGRLIGRAILSPTETEPAIALWAQYLKAAGTAP
jgi:hypothetical protein